MAHIANDVAQVLQIARKRHPARRIERL